MKPASPIGKEWNEQIDFLQEKLVGTDGTIALNESGYPTDEEVLADVQSTYSTSLLLLKKL